MNAQEKGEGGAFASMSEYEEVFGGGDTGGALRVTNLSEAQLLLLHVIAVW